VNAAVILFVLAAFAGLVVAVLLGDDAPQPAPEATAAQADPATATAEL